MICSSCRPNVVICPQCRGRFSGGHRLYFAERMLEKVPIMCKYADKGCDVELVSVKMIKHEAVCPHAEVECDNTEWGCRDLVPRRQLADHTDKCKYKPVQCPVKECQERIAQYFLMRHLTKKHNFKQNGLFDLGTMNCLFLLIFFLSLVINVSFLYS